MTLSESCCPLLKHSHTAELQGQSWLQQHSCTWRGVKAWTVAAPDGCPMAVCATPSLPPGCAVEGLRQASKLSTASATKLVSQSHPAFMTFIVLEVSVLCITNDANC